MDEKTQARIKKLQALAERGVGGEKETAARKLQELLKKNGISSVEELARDEYIFTLFSYNGVLGRKLLSQCIYKVKVAFMAKAIERKTRVAMVESSEG